MYSYKFPEGTEVTFKPPSYNDRRQALKQYDQKDGYAPEELLAAMCLLSVNGRTYDNEWDTTNPITRYEVMSLRDQSLYVQLFLQMFQPDDTEKNKIQEDAKKLLAGNLNSSSKKEKPSNGTAAVSV